MTAYWYILTPTQFQHYYCILSPFLFSLQFYPIEQSMPSNTSSQVILFVNTTSLHHMISVLL